uniref:Protein kinase domain-containing protein n=1 Tax=Ditylenchus dipsaci TaxID=166011 RepID=A0A915EBQ9_9BILA
MPEHLSPACKQLISRMLVRNPCQRATLAEVIQSPWVVAGDRGHAEVLPLICRDQLPDCAHTTIVEQMVAGQIGTEDEILSYMTATYYLLAERVLSAYRQQQAHQLLLINNPPGTSSEDETEGCQPNPHNSTGVLSGRSRSNSWRGPSTRRACTILKEESEEELSSYLRSSSRQSSRFYTKPSSRLSSLAPSRANSTDSFQPKANALIPDITQEEDEPEEGDLLPDLQLHSNT